MGEPAVSSAPAPGKWSPKEVIGHLIDSAGNNHQRFVRAQLPDARAFDGYAQDAWVKLQQYNEADWPVLIDLWSSFNLHLAHVMDSTSRDELERPRPDLQLGRLSFRSVEEPVTLLWSMQDYVVHLKHHLRQIDPALIDALHARHFTIAVETNGTIAPPSGLDWVCVSPKAGAPLRVRAGHELKLVYPQEGAPPEDFAGLAFERFSLQPMDGPDVGTNTEAAVRYCLDHPQWRLSLQTHKLIGIP